MKIFGIRSKLAIEVKAGCVDVFVAAQWLTEADNQPYVPAFATRLRATRLRLEKCLNFQANEDWFLGMGVDEAYHALASANSQLPGSVFEAQRIADWGPTTDGYLTFLLPMNGKLYLATAACMEDRVFAEEVSPWDLISVIALADDLFQTS